MPRNPDALEPPAGTSPRRLWLVSGLITIVAAALISWWQTRPDRTVLRNGTIEKSSPNTNNRSSPPAVEGGSTTTATADTPGESQENSPEPDGPAITRASQRATLVTPSGARKSVVDPMASWTDLPPWPEGPRLYAEVETSSKRYINLRPDDYGALPRILTNPGERLEIKITIPDAEPGEKIHVELPNGGAFSDSKVVGRIYDVQEGHSLTFSVFADEARGNCNVKMRHRGHTRSIPIWVGEPEETGS